MLCSVFVCTIASTCTSGQISKDARTNSDKTTLDLPELSLSLVFSGHSSKLHGFRLRFYALPA